MIKSMILCMIALALLPRILLAQGVEVDYPPDPQILNVKDFGAKGDGATDDTDAIKKCFAEVSKKHFRMAYFPTGTYLVGDTFGWRNFNIMQGQNRETTIIKLKDNCPGYNDVSKPKAVVRCLYNNNESIGNYMADFTVDTGKGNVGAIGVRYNCHNWGTLERVTIRTGDGKGKVGLDLSETEFGPALVREVLVEGFDVGIKTPGQPSNATLERITVKNQNVAGLENHFPLSLRTFTSVNKVPAILNKGGCLTQLVLIDADLSGGTSASSAIENAKGCGLYLRNIKSSDYQSALKDEEKVLPGASIDSYVNGEKKSAFPSTMEPLKLPIEELPEVFYEPVSQWKIVDDSAEDDTQNIQVAIDSGAKTICFKSNGKYRITDTIKVRGAVRRLLCILEGGIGADFSKFGPDKPLIRVEGEGTDPVVFDRFGLSAYPNTIFAVEIATKRPVFLRGLHSPAGCNIRNSPESKGGKLFIDEMGYYARFETPMSTWIWQCNTENNPFNPKKPKLPTYFTQNGGNLWIFSMKTESPAVNLDIKGGAKTEILGGFFRDHFSEPEYGGNVPFFKVTDSTLCATYTSYAWGPGKARGFQMTETRGGETKELRINAGNAVVNLLSTQGKVQGTQPARNE